MTGKMIPLYKSVVGASGRPEQGNAGLWYDKFCAAWQKDPEQRWTMKKVPGDQTVGPKMLWLQTVVGKKVGDKSLLEEMVLRQRQLLEAWDLKPSFYQVQGAFVTGMGRSHPVENGFCWHHGLGVPYLPGTSIKGLLRNWITVWEREYADELDEWLGCSDPDKSTPGAGGFIFLDAVPVECPSLAVDILTPHMGKWYAEGRQRPGTLAIVPADWHDPVPAPFLVVRQATFSFAVLPRSKKFTAVLPRLHACLENALRYLGAGAKTAVGYGRMVRDVKLERQCNVAGHSPEEQLREELAELTDEQLAAMFSTKFNAIKKQYQDKGVWAHALALVAEFHGARMRDWGQAPKKNMRKALKKFESELRALAENEK